uniref:histidine kinase n=1 Tax=Desulfatirhabdium butyrativorans TaxID=340467 RepID=A0A7C4RUD2_9BACT
MNAIQKSIPRDPFLHALLDHGDFGIVCMNDEGCIVRWNPWIAERTSTQPEQAVGKSLSEILPGTPKATLEACRQAMITGSPRVMSPVLHRFILPFSRPSLQIGRIFPAFNEENRCIGVVVVVNDVTPALDFENFVQKRVRLEQKDREDIFNAMAHPAFILDPDFRILDANRAMSDLLGMPIDAIIGQSCHHLLHDADRPIDRCPMLLVQRCSAQQQTEIHFEKFDRHFIVSCTPVFDEENRLCKMINILMDITEQKQIEAALRLSEERYQAFVKQSSEAICLFEIEHSPIESHFPVDDQIDLLYEHAVIRECNRMFAASHGYEDPDEMIGFRIGQVFPRLAPENVAYLRQFIQDGYHISNTETKELARDGSLRYFLNSLIGHLDDGRLVRIWGAKQDITKIKRVEEEIRKLNAELEQRVADRTAQLTAVNRELEAFAFSVSHDLRAPLRAIEGYTRILAEDYGPRLDPEGRRICSTIQNNTQNLRRLIEDLLAYSRTARSEMERIPVDMKSMAYSIYHEATTPEDRGRIDLVLADIPMAIGDPTLLRRLWMNLLSNAVKFSAKKDRPRIEIGYDTAIDPEGTPRQAYFVRDNGVGFDMRYAHKLFAMFQRLHGAAEFEGTGMGLAIALRIIQRHAGKIWAEGEPENGATFHFTLESEESHETSRSRADR